MISTLLAAAQPWWQDGDQTAQVAMAVGLAIALVVWVARR